MKTIFSTFALACLAFAAQAQSHPDTIVVRLPNQVVLTLQVRDARQLRQLPQYHLDSLVARLGTYIERADAAAATAKTDKVTLEFFPDHDQPGQGLPEEIRVTTYRQPGQNGPRGRHVRVTLDDNFTLKVRRDNEARSAAARGRDEARRDSLRDARQHRHAASTNFVLDLGLNALTNRGSGAPDLRTFGSRYVSLGLNVAARLGGRRSPLALVFGPEFSFNNYMLEGNHKWVNQNGFTSVVLETNGRQYQKTKLATSAFTVPLMLQLDLTRTDATTGKRRAGFTLGAGGFVSYRLGSWTKLKYFEEGNTHKDKDYGSYNLNDWQYGLQGVVGYGDQLKFFVKYNLNSLFRDGQGPQAQTLAFGIRLFGS